MRLLLYVLNVLMRILNLLGEKKLYYAIEKGPCVPHHYECHGCDCVSFFTTDIACFSINDPRTLKLFPKYISTKKLKRRILYDKLRLKYY